MGHTHTQQEQQHNQSHSGRWNDDLVSNETDCNEVGISNYSNESARRDDLRDDFDFDFEFEFEFGFFNSNNWKNINSNNILNSNIRRSNDNNNNNNINSNRSNG